MDLYDMDQVEDAVSQTLPANKLETENIGKLLLGYSLPAIISMTLVSLYNIIDSIFIGYGVGAMAISGLAVAFPFMNLVMAVCLLVAVGGSTICSIELGCKNKQRAIMVLGHVVMLSLIFGTAFGVIGLLLLDPVLKLFGASPETLPYAHDFMQIILISAPIACLMLSLSHLTRASGYPKKAMLISLLSIGVNLVLAPIFIFGLHWGIRGAALGTVIAQTVAMISYLIHFFDKRNIVHFQPRIFKLRPAVLKPMLAIGLSPFLMNMCGCLVVIVINHRLQSYGGDLAIGAFGIINRLLMLFAMIITGLTQGMQPILGYNFGARRPERVRQTLIYGVVAGTIVTTVGCLAAQIFPSLLVRMFTDDATLIALAINGLRISSLVFFLVGSQIVISSYFQSIGLASVAIFLSLSRQLVFLLPGLIFLPYFLDLDGVWTSMPVADVIAFVVTVAILRLNFRSRPATHSSGKVV